MIAALDAATGRPLWTRKLPSAPFGCATVASDVVFVPDLRRVDLRALGRTRGDPLEATARRAGINGCPSVAGDTLLVPAGAPAPRLRGAGAAADRVPSLVLRIGWMPWNKR